MSEADAGMGAAGQALREGRLEEAFRLAVEVLGARPGDLDAMLLIGVVAAKQGQAGIAIPMLSQVAEKDPSSYQAFFSLATALRTAGKPVEALAAAERAIELNVAEPQALYQRGLCLVELDRWAEARTCFEGAAKLAPNVGPLQFNLGMVLEELGHWEEATKAFLRAVTLNPAQVEAMYRLGQSLTHLLDYERAAEYAQRILKVDPHSVQGHSLLASALVGLNRPGEAKEHAAEAHRLAPDRYEVLTQYGTVLQAIGELEKAEKQFRRSIEVEPRQGYAYYGLVRTRKIRDADRPLIGQMEETAGDPGLARRHRGNLEYALGKAYADLGDYESAMGHYDAANLATRERKFGDTPFDEKEYAASTDFAIRNFERSFIEKYRDAGVADGLPVFVVGMMRSGTTLAEQILSSHPEIGGAGEQRFWMANRGGALEPPGNVLNEDRLRRMTSAYLAALRKVAPGKGRVVDKMPGNYALLGLIHVALPDARIVHLRRNPIDTCLSIWTTPNSSLIPWSNNKRDIVFAYREYLRIMEHWRTVIPEDRLLEIDYEELVADPEQVTRKMIAFCRLEWEERCLRPEENARAVATPSDWQVRQPIYRNAVERWRSYAPWLGEFLELKK